MQYHKLTTGSPFLFEAGGGLPSIDIVYHTSPHERRPGEKVIWICHALTANSDPEDWWPQMVGPGRFFDTDRDFIVCVNMLCSPYGSSSPRFINPDTGEPYYFNFPATTVRDMARTMTIVRRHLGIERVDMLIGSSIGGFQALEMAIDEPDVYDKAVFMATAPRISPWFDAGVETQRMALEADPTFRACRDLKGGAMGLRCARAQAVISYRSYEGYCSTQAEADPDCLFAGRASSYQRHQGDKLVSRDFDAYSYWYLCNVLDSHNVGRKRGGVEAALGRIKASSTVVAIDSDCGFPPHEGMKWAPMIPGAEFRTVTSKFGHDGFLLETGQIIELLTPLCK